MRHIYYIATALLVLSLLTAALMLTRGRRVEGIAVITVNDRVITEAELRHRSQARPHDSAEEDFVTSLVTRELLIQAARESGIHKEEAFRRSVQDYYEQSLIKILIDRKLSELEATITDREVDRYLDLCGKQLCLSVFEYPSEKEAGRWPTGEGRKLEMAFDGLSNALAVRFLSLAPGEFTGPVRTGDTYTVYRLDRVEGTGDAEGKGQDPAYREVVRAMLLEERKREVIDRWVAGLKENAEIKVDGERLKAVLPEAQAGRN